MLGRSATSVLVLTALSVSAASSAPDPRAQLTLPDAVQLALQKNPLIRAKQREHDATRAGETTAGLRPNPTASYLAEQLGSSGVSPQYTVALSQTIETGGKRSRRIDSARAVTRVSELELADLRRQVIAQVKKAFTDVLAADATVSLASENLQNVDELERLNLVRVEKGEIAELELLRVQTQRFAFNPNR